MKIWMNLVGDPEPEMVEEVVRAVSDMHGLAATSAVVVGPVAMDADDGHLLFCQFRDKDEQPLDAGYILIQPHNGKSLGRVNQLVNL